MYSSYEHIIANICLSRITSIERMKEVTTGIRIANAFKRFTMSSKGIKKD